MSVASALVLFAVLWFLCLFLYLPMNVMAQGEAGKIVKGTPASAPVDPRLVRKFKLTTLTAFLIWIPVSAIILSGLITIEDIDFFNRWGDGRYG